MPEKYIAGVRLSQTSQEKLIKAARQAADDHNFCEEVDAILESLGFDVPTREESGDFYINLELTYPAGYDPENSSGKKFKIVFDDPNITINAAYGPFWV